MKKLGIIFLSGVLAVSAAACGQSTKASAETNKNEQVTEAADISETEAPESAAAGSDATNIRFYLVRHGQTHTNIKDVLLAGSGNAPLTAEGRSFAYYAGMGLAEENVEFMAAYCSPLDRTYETAYYVLEGMGSDIPIGEEPLVKDMSWGVMEATVSSALEENYGKPMEDNFDFYFGDVHDAGYASPVEGQETAYQFAERFEDGLENIVSQHQGESGNILVTSHSTLGFFASKLSSEDDLVAVSNTSVTIVDYIDGEFTLVDMNNKSYRERGQEIYEGLQELEIYLVTSPQTRFNSIGVLEGITSTELTADGEAAAAAVAEVIGGEPTAVYRSTAVNSEQAAGITYLNRTDTIIEDNRLDDLFKGYWEGELLSALEETESADLALLLSADSILQLTARDGDGEVPMVAAGRLDSILKEVGMKYQASEGKIVMYTHPYLLKAYLNAFHPEFEVQLSDNAQITKLIYRDNTFTAMEMTEIN